MSAIARLLDTLLALDRRYSAALARRAAERPCLGRIWALAAHAGDGAVCLVAGLLFVAVQARAGRLYEVLPPLLRIVGAVLLTALVVSGSKLLVRRERPEDIAGARWSTLPRYDLYSFPSGHAARTFCIAVGILLLEPRWGALLMLWALAVCWARVSVAAHHLLDVVAGALLGAAVAVGVITSWPW